MRAMLAEAVMVTASIAFSFLCTGWLRLALEGLWQLAGCAWHGHRQLSTPCGCWQGLLLRPPAALGAMNCCRHVQGFHGGPPAEQRLASGGEHQLQPPPVAAFCTQVPNTQHTAHSLKQPPATPSTCQRSPCCPHPRAPALPSTPARCVHPTPLPTACLPVPLGAVAVHALASTPATQLVMGACACALHAFTRACTCGRHLRTRMDACMPRPCAHALVTIHKPSRARAPQCPGVAHARAHSTTAAAAAALTDVAVSALLP